MKKNWFLDKYGTAAQRQGGFRMNAPILQISSNLIYPQDSIPVNRQAEHILFCLCCYSESRGEPDEGQKAVASVILNRFNARKIYFGLTIRDVILRHNCSEVYQFSGMNPRENNYGKLIKPEMLDWVRIVKNCLPIYLQGVLQEYKDLYYFCKEGSDQSDFFESIQYVKTIGNHRFYSE